jgi:8-oxo-dGTP pyrophosphatase MutT (NUDIX family)
MEQGPVLPAGAARLRLTPDFVRARFAHSHPARRPAPPDIAAVVPEVGRRGDHDLNPGMEPRRPLVPAGVLVPLLDRSQGLTVLLTRRTEHLQAHAGQVSFPGGRLEPGDHDSVDAALREAEEEIGLARERVATVGCLDIYVTRTGFEVTPVVGIVDPPAAFHPDDFEVAEVFEVPLEFILDRANHQRHSRIYEGVERHFYVLPWANYYIWGATAGMLVNLADVLLAGR